MSCDFRIHALSRADIVAADFSNLQIFSRFRRHPGFSVAEQMTIFRHELLEALAENGACEALCLEDRIVAVVAVRLLAWDSDHFGLPMARMHIAAADTATVGAISELVGSVAAQFRQHSAAQHFSLEVDIDDYSCLNGALGAGFQIMDVKRTYCARKLREDIDFIRLSSRVRPFREEDREAVRALVAQVDFVSRFSRDGTLDADRARALYQRWFESLLREADSSVIALVFQRAGKVAACGVIEEADLSRYGVSRRLFSGGLYASGLSGAGGYIPVMHALTTEAARRHGIVDTTVSLNNTAPCRVLESFRSYSGTVTRYALRLYLA